MSTSQVASPDNSSSNNSGSIIIASTGPQQQLPPNLNQSQQINPSTSFWNAQLAAAAANHSNNSSLLVNSSIMGGQKQQLDQQMINNRNIKISSQTHSQQLNNFQGVAITGRDDSSYDDSSCSPNGRGDSSLILSRKNNFAHLTPSNMKIIYSQQDQLNSVGISDAEVAAAQAQFQNQKLIQGGFQASPNMNAIQLVQQQQNINLHNQIQQQAQNALHSRIRSSSNNSAINNAPSFGMAGNGLSSSLVNLQSQNIPGELGVSNQAIGFELNHYPHINQGGRNSINITNIYKNTERNLFQGGRSNLSQNLNHNVVQASVNQLTQSQPNLSEHLNFNIIQNSSSNDFGSIMRSNGQNISHSQSPDKKGRYSKRQQNHSQNNRGDSLNSQNQYQPGAYQINNNPRNQQASCPYHFKPFVAFCIIHNELVCEECCDLSHHRDHNNQILLLKAAAQNFIQNVDKKLDHMIQNRTLIANCEKFNLRYSIRSTINDFFDEMRSHIDELQRKKMNEMNKILKETNFINVQLRAKELDQRADICEQFFTKKRHEYNQRNYTKFLSKTVEIDKIVKQSDKIIRDTNFLLKESEKQRQIQLIHEKDKAKQKLKKVIDQNLKMPLVGYNKEMLDTLHFFVYNTHNLFMYNFRSHSYRSYVVNIKIPANFMSVENEEGRIFLTGGGEPGKATKSCYEFVEERLVQRRDMLFERRAHTLTSVLVEKQKSQIFAIGSSLPQESMNKCEVYDVATDTWTQEANLNTRRNFHTTLAFENKSLYVVAGFNGGQRTNLIEKFDLKERNHWETLNLKIKENTNWICLEGCGLFQISLDHMIIFGGFTTSDQKTNHCYLFNVHTNEIEQLNCKTRTQSNFYQRQPKRGGDGKLYCVETNSLDLHIFNLKSFEWDFIDRKYIGW